MSQAVLHPNFYNKLLELERLILELKEMFFTKDEDIRQAGLVPIVWD